LDPVARYPLNGILPLAPFERITWDQWQHFTLHIQPEPANPKQDSPDFSHDPFRKRGTAKVLELQATPVVAVTAFAMKGDEERIRESGCEGYLSKPIPVAKFIETQSNEIWGSGVRISSDAPIRGDQMPPTPISCGASLPPGNSQSAPKVHSSAPT
jgi:hypothetical protein